MEIGLHLNFTEDLGHNRILHPLPKLILLAYLRGLNRAALKWDIQRQFERFESVTGRMPDFVDGHQHVHQLPVIRDALLEVLNKRYGARKPWLRATRPPERWSSARLPLSVKFKAGLIASLGASSLSRLARTHGYSQNRHLLGVYGFDMSATRYLRQMRIWLKHAEDGDVLMCHPSLSGPWNDPLLGARFHEYQVLSGDAFAALVAWAGIKIGTLPLATTGLADTDPDTGIAIHQVMDANGGPDFLADPIQIPLSNVGRGRTADGHATWHRSCHAPIELFRLRRILERFPCLYRSLAIFLERMAPIIS